MIVKRWMGRLALVVAMLGAGAVHATAQITTGMVSGTVKDAQGAVIPGATVVLISETKGTRSAAVVTNETGDYVFPNVTADTYSIEVSMDGFKTLTRKGVQVSGADRVSVPPLTIEVGGQSEVVTVSAESPLVQASSGERSFAVTTNQIESLPITHGNFATFAMLTPGVIQSGKGSDQSGQAASRLGGAGQNNLMMDGVSAMDTGNNGQMLTLNIESIGEVKVLTQGYQAEYGRSSGLQITAVTKSGTNQFRGSAYDIQTDSDWDSNTWVRDKNGDPKVKTSQKTLGYTIGGPVGKPGGNNKLFFFYAHEYRPTTTAINNGNNIRLKVPTALERAGDFSQSVDNNGALFNLIKDPLSANACSTSDHSGCFQDGGVLGRIPANRLYQPGLAVLSRYPLPNVAQGSGTNYNYDLQPPTVDDLVQQPAIRLDYQMSSKLRVTGKYSGDRRRQLTRPGLIPGFSDVYTPYPYITNYAVTVNYTMSPTTFIEGTYGFIRNELTGGNENGVLINDSANRLHDMANFPLLYPNAGVVPQRSYAYQVMQDVAPPFWDGTQMNLPPVFGWGSRVQGTANACVAPAPPCQRYPGWLNINRTQDFAVSATKVAGHHTFKAGVYNNHSYKAQNVGAGGIANLSFQGYVNFGNDTNNALDSGFGYSNAALGVFTQYLQASQFIEGSMLYNNTEFYVQDNWKVNNRLTVDYGVRFTHQQPQYDQFQQMSNFFPDQFNPANAQVLYVAGCSNGAATCSGNTRNAMDPRNGQILTATGAANTQAAIGTPIPGSGNPTNGIVQAGNGIAKTGYTWPAIVVGPRFGAAYDLSGDQKMILRASGGLFYDRPDGNTVFSIPGNPPIATAQDLRSGQLQTLGGGLTTVPVPALVTFQYDAKIPAQWQWSVGLQRALPWSTSLDVSYVGNRGYNRLGNYQGGSTVNQNAIDIGAAYLPQNQDPTQTSTVPGNNTIDNLLRPYKGLGVINQNTTEFHDLYHSLQVSLNRRFRQGFAFGIIYTYGISYTGNIGIQKRLVHGADGSVSASPDEGQWEELMNTLDARPHILRANAVWDLPNSPASLGPVGAVILNDWQLSGVLSAGSGPAYDLTNTYQSNGSNKNLTGSPDYGARIVYVGDPGSGCSDNQYAQFAVNSVTGPSYHSNGMESGRNILRGCADKTVDLAIQRSIRVGGDRRLQFRLDAYNAFNTVIINARQTQVQFRSPTDLTVLNSEYRADGSIDPSRLKPNNAGFGAATGALPMRSMQLTVRFQF